MFEKIYIINLKDATDRNNFMKKEMEKQNLTNYLFFQAIDGENEDLDENYQFSVVNEWRDPFTRKCITKGEIGCALTHYWIWEEIVNHQYSSILILEDDVTLEENFLEKLNNIDIPKNMDFLYVGRRKLNRGTEEKINENIVIPNYSYGTHGYILTLEGAKKLLSYNFVQNIFPVDEFLPMIYDKEYPHTFMKQYFSRQLKESMNFYSLKNNLVHLYNFGSDTFNSSPYLYLKSPIQHFIILSVATHETDGYKRFIESCQLYGNPYKVLGLNTKWQGYGYKLLLLYEELSTWTIEQLEQTIILFSDSYDGIITSHYKDIIHSFKTFNTDKVIFQAEKACWPIKDLSNYYPETNSPYKYLNSGGFIGYGNKIFELLNYSTQQLAPTHLQELFINSSFYNTNKWLIDDQLYYTFLYLQEQIILDTECVLFQSLMAANEDIKINNNWSITNTKFNTRPIVVHGNGGTHEKKYLNQLSNYLINGWSSTFNYKLRKKIIEYPTIFIYCKESFSSVFSYPLNKIIFYHEKDFVKQFLDSNAEYLFYCYHDHKITNSNILTILLQTNKDIIAPLIVTKNSYYSNFWNDFDSGGWYKRSFDYIDIVEYKKKGVFNVPHIQECYLLHKKVLTEFPDLYNTTDAMSFCKYLRNKQKFMFVTNIENFNNVNNTEQSMYTYNDLWKSTYIHPNIQNEWNELGNDVFEFPLFTSEFCSELLDICNDKNEWSQGQNYDGVDNRIGNVENVPTQDVHLKQLNLEAIWQNVIKEYITPLIYKKFKYTTKSTNITFVVKYSMNGQSELKPHHDASTYTLNICLSDNFEGGGCRFIRQDKTVINKKIGYCTMHPGRVTHYHEALPITSGERYILVSFVN